MSREITVPTDRFAWQMAYLARHGFRTLRLDECRAMLGGSAPMDPKAVLLTFDDGYLDNLTDAVRIPLIVSQSIAQSVEARALRRAGSARSF